MEKLEGTWKSWGPQGALWCDPPSFAPASSPGLGDWDKDDVMMEIVNGLNQTLDNGVGICSSSGPRFARWLQAPFPITRPGDCHAPHDPIQDQGQHPLQGHATHPPWEHPWPWGQIQEALGAWLAVRVLPAEDMGTGCYSNRAASPVTYSHWRHMHCRIQPGLSQVAVLTSLCPTRSSTVARWGGGRWGRA